MNGSNQVNKNTRDAVQDLLHQLITRSHIESYFTIVDKFRILDQQSTLDILCEFLKHSDSELRFRSGEILLQLNAETTQEDVMVLFNDPSADIRAGIAYLFYEFGDLRAVDALVDLLLHDSDDDVRSNAAMALGGIGSEMAIPALEWAILHDEGNNFQDEPIKNTAKWAIEQIRSSSRIS